MSQNAKKPHTAIILLKIEVCHHLDTGECSNQPINLKEAGVEATQVVHITGFDKFDCIRKLKEAISNLKSSNG